MPQKKRRIKSFHIQQLKAQHAKTQSQNTKRVSLDKNESTNTNSYTPSFEFFYYNDGFGIKYDPANININYRFSNISHNMSNFLTSLNYCAKKIISFMPLSIITGAQSAEYHDYYFDGPNEAHGKLRLNTNAYADMECEMKNIPDKAIASIENLVLANLPNCNITLSAAGNATYEQLQQYFPYQHTKWEDCLKITEHCTCKLLEDDPADYLAELFQQQNNLLPETLRMCLDQVLNAAYNEELAKNKDLNKGQYTTWLIIGGLGITLTACLILRYLKICVQACAKIDNKRQHSEDGISEDDTSIELHSTSSNAPLTNSFTRLDNTSSRAASHYSDPSSTRFLYNKSALFRMIEPMDEEEEKEISKLMIELDSNDENLNRQQKAKQ